MKSHCNQLYLFTSTFHELFVEIGSILLVVRCASSNLIVSTNEFHQLVLNKSILPNCVFTGFPILQNKLVRYEIQIVSTIQGPSVAIKKRKILCYRRKTFGSISLQKSYLGIAYVPKFIALTDTTILNPDFCLDAFQLIPYIHFRRRYFSQRGTLASKTKLRTDALRNEYLCVRESDSVCMCVCANEKEW